jgi:hypothetical protein
MAQPQIKGRVVAMANTGPWLNMGEKYRSINELVRDAQSVLSAGYQYDGEMSWVLGGKEACFVFSGPGPDVILSYPIRRAKPYTDKFYEKKKRLMSRTEHYFL